MKNFCALLLLTAMAVRLDAMQVPLTVDTNVSTFELELCAVNVCDTQSSYLTGSVTIGLEAHAPSQIALHDFNVDALSDYNFLLDYGFLLGRIDANVAGFNVQHAESGPPQPFFPIIANMFTITNVPFLTSGDGSYNAQGFICTLLEGNGQPCSTNFNLAAIGTNYAESIEGTIQFSNDFVYLTIALNFSGPLVPDDPGLATITGAANISASGPLLRPLVSQGSDWKYLDDGSSPTILWRFPGFNDSAWDSGPAPLGYGDGDEATVINSGPVNNHFITTYFRRSFNVPDPSLYANLLLRVQRDDGAIVYLNSSEVFRSNMPTGLVSSSTLATTRVADAAETNFFATYLSPSRLNTGPNFLSVEVHQFEAGSSDVSFDLELLGLPDLDSPALNVLQSSGQIHLAWPVWAHGFELYSTASLTPPVVWSPESVSLVFTNGLAAAALNIAGGVKFFRLIHP